MLIKGLSKNSGQTSPIRPVTIMSASADKNSSGDEIANVNFYAVRPEATRIH